MCTGKSVSYADLVEFEQVYPRVYGEIIVNELDPNKIRGLPPCVRGNL